MTTNYLLQVEGLSRSFDSVQAVQDICFSVARGEVLGLLGPNGAGKSTTMKMISGNLAPSSGRIMINDVDLLDQPQRAKLELGYLAEHPPLYPELSVDEYLGYCARLHRVARQQVRRAVAEAKQRCGLDQVGRRLLANLSKGYQQRVGIAQAIIHQPALVVLDEPTVGLDPIQIREIRELIRELGQEHSVILSTHILPEVQSVCDRLQIINKGRLVFAGSVAAIQQQMQATHLIIALRNRPAASELLSVAGVKSLEAIDNERYRLEVEQQQDSAENIVQAAVAHGWGLYQLIPQQKSLEQIFVEITSADESELLAMSPGELR